jgi:hypothetical protein
MKKFCSKPLNCSPESAASDSVLNRLEASNLLKASKSLQPQNQSTATISPALPSGTTCEPLLQNQGNLTALSAEAPAKISAGAGERKDLAASNPHCGGKCSESSRNADLISLAGKTLKERCTAELEKLLPASEWSDMKLRAQSSYRQRSSELRTSESESSLLPTPTTYPSGSGKVSPAGRNKLETSLRTRANIPTPRANDGTQGCNNGKSGGMNLTSYLKLATPAARDCKGTSPSKNQGASATLPDNLRPFILPGETANPQVWGWMMGFPPNWCESVLMPPGFWENSDWDGGVKSPHPIKRVCSAKELRGGEIQSPITELPASPPKQSPSRSESSFYTHLPNTKIMDEFFDFGKPIFFGWTSQYLPNKSVTRRDWKDSYGSQFIRAFERAAAIGKKLRVPATDKAYYAGGKQIGWLIISEAPYKEALKNMPQVDLIAEGGMCATVEEFAAKYFKGDLEKEVWVLGFKFQPLKFQPLESQLETEEKSISRESPNPLTNCKTLGVLTSSKTDEHFTPGSIIYAVREVMGEIDLDPMSCAEANKTVRAAEFFDKAVDGLAQPWNGRVWLNPAFSLANQAVEKLLYSYITGTVSEAILLLKATPDTARHQSLAALPFCEWRGRVKFTAAEIGTYGSKKPKHAPFPILIFYLGKNFSKFKEIFAPLGNIRLGQTQVDELESDRRELLAEVARLQLELAKKSKAEGDNKPELDRTDWLERDLAASIGIAESRLKELELDREVLPDDLYIRQRVEWQSRLQALQEVQNAMAKIAVRFAAEYENLLNREHPQIESEKNYTPNFAPKKWVESSPETGSLLVRIENYRHTDIGWIAECNVRRSDRISRGSIFLIKACELFADFHVWNGYEREMRQPTYSLGSIRTAKGLRSHFPGIKLPSIPKVDFTEVKAPDNSIWQACKDGGGERAAIKWRCEVLPDGFSRSPRIENKKDDCLESVALTNFANGVVLNYV